MTTQSASTPDGSIPPLLAARKSASDPRTTSSPAADTGFLRRFFDFAAASGLRNRPAGSTQKLRRTTPALLTSVTALHQGRIHVFSRLVYNAPTSMQHQHLAGNTCSQGQRCKQAFARLEHQLHGMERSEPAYNMPSCRWQESSTQAAARLALRMVVTLHLTLPYFDCNSWKKPYLHSRMCSCHHAAVTPASTAGLISTSISRNTALTSWCR